MLDGARTVAVLEGVNDHENLGSIFRNAAGLGVDAVVFGSGCADPLYRRAVRVSMGHALLVPYAWAADWPADLEMLRDNGFRLLAMTPDPVRATLAEAMAAVRDERVAILVGAEGPGLTEPRCGRAICGCGSRCRAAPTRSTSPPPRRWRSTSGLGSARLAVTDESTPWATGLTVAAFVAAVTAAAVVVLSLGLIRVHPLLAVGLNLVAVGGLAPTVWGWRRTPVLRWFVLGAGVGVQARGWRCWRWRCGPMQRQRCPLERTPSSTSSHAGTGRLARAVRGRPAWASAAARALPPARASGSSKSSWATGATGRSGRAKSGSISSLAASSNAVTVPPCAPGREAEMRDVVGTAGLPAQLHRPAAVLVAPRVPVVWSGIQPARHQRRRDGLQQRQHRRAVGEHRMRGGCQLGRA